MTNAVSYTRSSAPNVELIIIALGDMKMASIYYRIAIAVANKRGFPVIVQVSIRNSDPLRSVADIYEAIIVVFVVGQVRIELAVAVSRENIEDLVTNQ